MPEQVEAMRRELMRVSDMLSAQGALLEQREAALKEATVTNAGLRKRVSISESRAEAMSITIEGTSAAAGASPAAGAFAQSAVSPGGGPTSPRRARCAACAAYCAATGTASPAAAQKPARDAAPPPFTPGSLAPPAPPPPPVAPPPPGKPAFAREVLMEAGVGAGGGGGGRRDGAADARLRDLPVVGARAEGVECDADVDAAERVERLVERRREPARRRGAGAEGG